MLYNLLSTLNESEICRVKYLNINKNKILFEEDSLCNCIGIVIKGKLSITSYSYYGKEITYSIIEENQLFGHNLLFSSSPYYKGNVIALSDSKIALINKDELIYLMQNNKEFLKVYLQILNNNTKNLNEKVKLLSFDSAIDRVLYYLYQNNNLIYYQSITELAKKLFLRRETLSRTLSNLVKDNIIEINNNTINKKQ